MITRTCLNRNELYEIRLALERAGIYYKIRQIGIKQTPEAISDLEKEKRELLYGS